MNQLLFFKRGEGKNLRIEYTGNKYSIAGCKSGEVVFKIVVGEDEVEHEVRITLEELAYLAKLFDVFLKNQIEELTSVHLALTKKIEDELQGKSDQYIK